ncbi:Organic cation/carnitine transporter 7 [Linum grandiflorum]
MATTMEIRRPEPESSYTVEEALTAAGFGKFQLLLLAYAGMGSFAEAMEMMILSFVGPALKSQWDLSSSQESLLTTVVFAGMLVGAYSWGFVADSYGRSVITSGAGILSTFAPNYTSLLILRCLVGVGVSGGSLFLSWFLEFVPASHRGLWMVVFSAFWTFGTIFEAALAWAVMPRLGWRWLLALSSIPSTGLLLFYCLVPESPRYLCVKGRTKEANDIMKKIALINCKSLPAGFLVPDNMAEQDPDHVVVVPSSSSTDPLLPSPQKLMALDRLPGFASFFRLFSKRLIRTTLLLWLLYFGNSFAYYGIILLTSELSSWQSRCSSSSLLAQVPQIADNNLYVDTFITSLAELPGLILSAVIVDRVGRKLSMALMFFLGFIFLAPLLLSSQYPVLTTAVLFGARMCISGTFTVACIFAPELYPTSVRATGAGVASSIGRIGGMVCPLVAVGLVTGCHLTEAVVLFEIVLGISAVCCLLFPRDTKGLQLRDNDDS